MGRMILCIGTTPAAQRVMRFAKLERDAVNRASQTLDGIAGKSINVAKVLATLGAQALATGFVGGDFGREVLRSLETRGVETDFVQVSAATRQCITVLDDATKTVTELVQESQAVAPEDYQTLLSKIEVNLPRCRAVVMSGSLTPGGPQDFYKRIVQRAQARGILTVVDARGAPLLESLPERPGLVKPNRAELAGTVQRTLGSEAEVIDAMREVQRRGAAHVVVTGGTAPILALEKDQAWRINPPVVPAVNPIGSGDAFTAGLIWRLVQGDSLGEACRWAAAAGAANALSQMPGELSLQDVRRLAGPVVAEKLQDNAIQKLP